MTQLAADTFTRANTSSGLGTSSDGQVWSAASGSPVTGIANNEGYFQGGASFPSSVLGTKTTKNSNILMRISQNANTSAGVGPCFRYQSVGNTYFVALYQGVLFAFLSGGAFTSIATGSIPSLPSNGYYWVRAVMQNAHCQVRVWPDSGSAEPATWNIDVSDTTYTSAGQFGITTNGAGGQVYFDHLLVTDNTSGSAFLRHKNRIGQVLS